MHRASFPCMQNSLSQLGDLRIAQQACITLHMPHAAVQQRLIQASQPRAVQVHARACLPAGVLASLPVRCLASCSFVRPQNGLRHALSRGGMHSMPTPMTIRCKQHGEAARPRISERNMLHRASTLGGLPGAVSTCGGHAGQRHSTGHHESGSEPPGKRLSAPASPSRKLTTSLIRAACRVAGSLLMSHAGIMQACNRSAVTRTPR